MSHPKPIRKEFRLCYVTDRKGLSGAGESLSQQLIEKIEEAAQAGVDWIQIREKDLPADELERLAREAVRRADARSCVLVNGRPETALAAGAAGVHLGEAGPGVAEVKRWLRDAGKGEALLTGASAHSREAALRAEREGADYVIFGPVFATPSKAAYGQPQGLEKLAEVCRSLRIPVIAIGGITTENASECAECGAGGVAAIRIFQESSDLAKVVAKLRGGA